MIGQFLELRRKSVCRISSRPAVLRFAQVWRVRVTMHIAQFEAVPKLRAGPLIPISAHSMTGLEGWEGIPFLLRTI